MGADLIGFMAKGPAKLDHRLREAAIGIAATAIGEAILYVNSDPYDCDKTCLSVLDNAQEEDFDRISLLNPEEVVDSLFSVWEGGARDCASRLDPDDPDSLIIFAGCMSWGDEPDGYGYETLRDAQALGLFEVFGIR